jgi:hypothetical protein
VHVCSLFTAVSPFKGAAFDARSLAGAVDCIVQSQGSSAMPPLLYTSSWVVLNSLSIGKTCEPDNAVGMATGYGLEGFGV